MAALGGLAGSEYSLSSFFQQTKAMVAEAEHFVTSFLSNEDIDSVERLHDRLAEAGDTVFTLKQRAFDLVPDVEMETFYNAMAELSAYLTRLRIYFQNLASELRERTDDVSPCQCDRVYTGMTGQPKYQVSKRQIECLRELHFWWTRIAQLLGISTKTLRRRRQEFQIDDEQQWSSISEAELREMMREIMNITPGLGQTRMLGALKSRGIKVQRSRVRILLRELDPVGTALRWRGANLSAKLQCALLKCFVAH